MRKPDRAQHIQQVLEWIGDGANDRVLHAQIERELGLSFDNAVKLIAESRQALVDLETQPEGFYRVAFLELFKSSLSAQDFSTAYKALSKLRDLDAAAAAARSAPAFEDSRAGAMLLLADVIRKLLAGEITNAMAQTAIQATQALIRGYDAAEEETEERPVEIPDISRAELSRRFTDSLERALGASVDFDLERAFGTDAEH